MTDMRAAALSEIGASPILTRVARPELSPREALVRVRAVGLCGSDLKIASGAMRPDLALPAVHLRHHFNHVGLAFIALPVCMLVCLTRHDASL